MNAQRMAELDRHPERATLGELVLAAGFVLVILTGLVGLLACLVARATQGGGQ